MTDTDDRLRALFAADEPPARDPAFSAAVMEAVMRRRFLLDMALLAGATAVGALVLWALWPAIQPWLVEMSAGLAPVAAALALGIGVVVILGGRLWNPLRLES